ncbi:hypothetical protein AMS68_002991 [Peltaster fructicola]|uniref:Protein root UVB sensitive/RUS domain-containing protein n=1 Tax=Peltaster fructicola TaxID=286661 RepID=A0A6H0XRW1_9PEZI|nr:hypothetical protein AMS68_002991 [Peltaster fructicola]
MTEYVETDEVGTPMQTYLISTNEKENEDRVDIVRPAAAQQTLWQVVLDIFLPAGFPNSVTNDYIEYQIYDSLQAFASSIAGLLSSRAVLSTLGVGDASSSATNAVIFNVLQESLGRLATIGFAYRLGTTLEPECKMYRLLADVLNDFAFVLDCLSPVLPSWLSVLALSFAGVLRALCGVAAGSSKASLSAHFAKWGNLGELNAKDSSQETIISLLGMLAGTVVVSYINTPFATWTALIALLAVHLEMNRRAVRAVALKSLNRQRAGLMFHRLCKNEVPTPQDVSIEEHIFELGGTLRAADGGAIGHCTIGCKLEVFLRSSGTVSSTGAVKINKNAMASLNRAFVGVKHILWYDVSLATRKIKIFVALKNHAGPRDILLAWWHAVALASLVHDQRRGTSVDPESTSNVVERSLKVAVGLIETYASRLQSVGWDLDASVILTRPAPRLDIKDMSLS